MKSATKFWLVCNLEKNQPVVQHPTKRAATAEALRLSKKEPNNVFYVLKPVVSVSTELTPNVILCDLK